MADADVHLDCKNMNCPMPIIELSKAMRKLDPGQIVEVEATDRAFESDLRAWVAHLGHELDGFQDGDVMRAVVRKRS